MRDEAFVCSFKAHNGRYRRGVVTCAVVQSDRLVAANRRLEKLKLVDAEVSKIVRTRGGDLLEVSGEEDARSAAYKSANERKQYDPEQLEEYFKDRHIECWRRRLQVATPLLAFATNIVLDYQLGRATQNRRKRATEFMELVASLGPAFIKAGQALSSRPDLLPPEYLQELQKLQDRLPPFDNEQAFDQIESELGGTLQDLFERIDPEPVAAASIGQVYKGYLKTGEEVAIKVQRPNCEKIIALDIYILRRLSGLLNELLRLVKYDFDLKLIVDEFGKLIYDEIDYLNEARNAERFKDLYGNMEKIFVPKVYWRYTSAKVITLEWVEGVRLESDTLGENRSELVRSLVQCSLRQMLENGFFHADPHGGNLLATGDASLCYLDFGMTSTLTQEQSYGIILAIVDLVNRDWENLVALYKRLGILDKDADEEPIVKALNDALPDVLDASVGQFNFKSVISKLGTVFYSFDFQLPPYYTAILRCLGVLEGVAIQVDPEFKILNEAYPFVASRLLSDDSAELRSALELFLVKDGELVADRWTGLLTSASRMNGDDVSAGLNSFLEYILADDSTEMRYMLADLLVDELDGLGVDLTKYLRGYLANNSLFSLQGQPGDAQMSPKLQQALSLVNDSLLRKGVRIDDFFGICQRFIALPAGQKFAAEVILGVAERYASRTIRAIFRLPPAAESSRRKR